MSSESSIKGSSQTYASQPDVDDWNTDAKGADDSKEYPDVFWSVSLRTADDRLNVIGQQLAKPALVIPDSMSPALAIEAIASLMSDLAQKGQLHDIKSAQSKSETAHQRAMDQAAKAREAAEKAKHMGGWAKIFKWVDRSSVIVGVIITPICPPLGIGMAVGGSIGIAMEEMQKHGVMDKVLNAMTHEAFAPLLKEMDVPDKDVKLIAPILSQITVGAVCVAITVASVAMAPEDALVDIGELSEMLANIGVNTAETVSEASGEGAEAAASGGTAAAAVDGDDATVITVDVELEVDGIEVEEELEIVLEDAAESSADGSGDADGVQGDEAPRSEFSPDGQPVSGDGAAVDDDATVTEPNEDDETTIRKAITSQKGAILANRIVAASQAFEGLTKAGIGLGEAMYTEDSDRHQAQSQESSAAAKRLMAEINSMMSILQNIMKQDNDTVASFAEAMQDQAMTFHQMSAEFGSSGVQA